MKSRDTLIEENLGLVYSCAKKLSGRGIEYEELVSAGYIGLINAATRFDEALGFRFSTFAVPSIIGEMKRIFRDGGTVKVSRSLKELSLKAQRAAEEFRRREGEEPTVSQLSEILGVSLEEAAEALSASMTVKSLSNALEDGSDIDIAVASKEESITERMTLYQVIDELSLEDRELIKLRYFKGKTQTQTAETLGISQVQVSRKEKKILLSMREKMLV
ncbi:MAG: sigma-70 family RNA polymerase sigma factor [Oscillospiraceae bacterium]|nr:sigma-70 family RNA polymerase sigma factor [Oscillospiraceae bacterium]